MLFRYFFILITFVISESFSAEIVYRVPIENTIDLGLPPFIERAIQEAEDEGASAIIFDIDTFGGRVDGATQIKDAILDAADFAISSDIPDENELWTDIYS